MFKLSKNRVVCSMDELELQTDAAKNRIKWNNGDTKLNFGRGEWKKVKGQRKMLFKSNVFTVQQCSATSVLTD